MDVNRSSHAVWECRYHLVWSTKYRKRALEEEYMREACKDYLRQIAEQYGLNILNLEVDIDHLHIYIEIPPQRSVGSAVGILKSKSARFMFQQYPILKKMLWAGKLWEASYFVRGVGEGVTAAMIDNYIDQHSEKAVSFKQLELFPKGKE
jgi:putative transposase